MRPHWPSFRTLPARMASFVWAMRGRRALDRGDLPRALAALERAVSCRPRAFRPLLLLARGYLEAQETWRAHRTLSIAREAHPERFARVAPQWLHRHGVDLATLGRVLGVESTSVPVRSTALAVQGEPARARPIHPAELPYGDCRDLDEYARFQAMPPITEAERASIDWERVLDDLLDD